MSDNSVVDEKQGKEETGSNQEPKAEYVARKAYEDVSRDMHKYKSQAKDFAAKQAELEATITTIKENELKEQQRWEELYKMEKEQKEKLSAESMQKDELFKRSVKLNAIKGELGGNIKDEYLNFAKLDMVSINDDGTISSESVREVANRFREEHPSLIPSSKAADINSNVIPNQNISNQELDLSKMTFDQKAALLREIKNK